MEYRKLRNKLTHEYPNGANYPVSAPLIFWEFFKRSVAVATEHQHQGSIDIYAYPNPSNNLVTISIPKYHGNYHWSLYDTQGNLQLNVNQANGEAVQFKKSELGTGLFLFRADLGTGVLSQKIIFN